jgi:hypothetical protein
MSESSGRSAAAVQTATPEPLKRHRELIATAMRAAVGRLALSVQQAVSYHLGRQDADGDEVNAPAQLEGCSLDAGAAGDLREVAMSVTSRHF